MRLSASVRGRLLAAPTRDARIPRPWRGSLHAAPRRHDLETGSCPGSPSGCGLTFTAGTVAIVILLVLVLVAGVDDLAGAPPCSRSGRIAMDPIA